MQLLKTHTVPTTVADTFLVYWSNGAKQPKGIIKVRITADIEDKSIAAELAVMQHLLEVQSVLGDKVVGNANTQLVVSLGAIRKLHRMQSDKAHLAPYANFLTTRFAGCSLSVDKDTRWFANTQPLTVQDLLVTGPLRETLTVTGLGTVAVTQHVLARFALRYMAETTPDKVAQHAWKKLVAVASDRSLREVTRTGVWNAVQTLRDGKQPSRYFLNPQKGLVLVVTDNPREGKRLVTTYPANHQFRELAA